MPPLFESPSSLVSTTTSFSFSLSLSFSLHFAIPSPIRNQPLHPSLPRASTRFFVIKRRTAAKIKNQPTYAFRNRPGVGFIDNARQFRCCESKYTPVTCTFAFIYLLLLSYSFSLCATCSSLYDLPLMRGPTLLT